jgi:hypothetical protein
MHGPLAWSFVGFWTGAGSKVQARPVEPIPTSGTFSIYWERVPIELPVDGINGVSVSGWYICQQNRAIKNITTVERFNDKIELDIRCL